MNTDNKKNETKQCTIPRVSTRYLCECGWCGEHKEMKNESDFGYDQSCCPDCNTVMINNLHWEVYCNVC